MPRADIYRLPHSADGGVQFACRLTQKAFQQGYAVRLQIADPQRAAALDKALWDFRPDSFVPHTLSDADAADRPVQIVVPAPVAPISVSRDAVSPDSASRDAPSPDSAPSDAATPDSASPDSAPSDAATPNAATSDTASPDSDSRDAAAPDTASPDPAPRDTSSPNSDVPDSASRDAAAPDTASPDPAPSDTASPAPNTGEDAQAPQLLAFLGEPPETPPDCERVAEILITEDEARAAERLEFYRTQGYEVHQHSIPAS